MTNPNPRMMAVWRFWASCVDRGCQLWDPREWQEGFDYLEPNNAGWLTWVAAEALMLEFNRDRPEWAFKKPQHYTAMLGKIILESRAREKMVILDIDGNRMSKKRSFVLFKPCRWYKDRLHGESYNACFRRRH